MSSSDKYQKNTSQNLQQKYEVVNTKTHDFQEIDTQALEKKQYRVTAPDPDDKIVSNDHLEIATQSFKEKHQVVEPEPVDKKYKIIEQGQQDKTRYQEVRPSFESYDSFREIRPPRLYPRTDLISHRPPTPSWSASAGISAA